MGIDTFKEALQENPESNSFATTMQVIDENYNFTPTAFRNGRIYNAADENNGSCKLFYFASLQKLDKELTLACFGEYYFKDVLQDLKGEGHQNIRNFMDSGWSEVDFEGAALQPK